MATVSHSSLQPQGVGSGVQVIRWTPLTTANLDGEWISLPDLPDVSFHVFGTFGAAATLTIQGSHEVVATPTAPVTVRDSQGAAMTFLTAGGNDVKQAVTAMLRYRPLLSGGDGTTSLTIIAMARRDRG